ncbi:MAG: hypothetical protein ABSA46_20765 [Thermodesulfovibrionales bacterium]|jgi:hypothetical protein
MKLLEKTRIGSKVIKKYDKPKTPYRRVLASPHVSDNGKEVLKGQYAKLNPAQLKRQITRLQQKLLRLNTLKQSLKKRNVA